MPFFYQWFTGNLPLQDLEVVIYQVMCLSHDNSDVDVVEQNRIRCNCVSCKPSEWLNVVLEFFYINTCPCPRVMWNILPGKLLGWNIFCNPHLWQGGICKPKILTTYLDEIVSFMSPFLLWEYLLSYLDYSHAFVCGANIFVKFWIWLMCILIMWLIPANQILFWWI